MNVMPLSSLRSLRSVVGTKTRERFTIRLVRKVEISTNNDDFRIVYRITKEPADGFISFDGLAQGDTARRLIHDNGQFKKWKGHIAALNRII